MFVLGNFILAIAMVIHYVLSFLMWMVVIRAVLSWVSPDPYNPIVRFVHNVTEPILYQVRKRLPLTHGGVDLSPVVVFLVIMFIEQFVVGSLGTFATKLK